MNRLTLEQQGVPLKDIGRILTVLRKSYIYSTKKSMWVDNTGARAVQTTRYVQYEDFKNEDILGLCNDKLKSKDTRVTKELWIMIKGLL